MRALVTGANGLIGANLVRELLQRGVDVRGLVRTSSDLSALEGLTLELHRAELGGDIGPLETAADGCDFVFHTAMHFTYDRSREADLDVAAERGTRQVIEAAARTGVRRVVLTSSSVIFGYRAEGQCSDESCVLVEADGRNHYVDAKVRQNELAFELGERLGVEVVAVCPTVVLGPHGSRLGPSNGLIIAYLSDPFRCTYPGGCNLVSSADVANGHWLAATRGEPAQHYILGSENLTWRAVHGLIAELAGVPGPRFELNHSLSYLAATLEELHALVERRAPLGNRDQAGMVGRYYWYTHDRAAAIGYRPRSARIALAEALSWLTTSRHVSRELRAGLRLHDEVYAARWSMVS